MDPYWIFTRTKQAVCICTAMCLCHEESTSVAFYIKMWLLTLKGTKLFVKALTALWFCKEFSDTQAFKVYGICTEFLLSSSQALLLI